MTRHLRVFVIAIIDMNVMYCTLQLMVARALMLNFPQ